jgi:hypothetical protein
MGGRKPAGHVWDSAERVTVCWSLYALKRPGAVRGAAGVSQQWSAHVLLCGVYARQGRMQRPAASVSVSSVECQLQGGSSEC